MNISYSSQWTLYVATYIIHILVRYYLPATVNHHHELHLDYTVVRSHYNTLKTFKHLNHNRGAYKANYGTTSTSKERTRAAVPKCPLFRGSTVIMLEWSLLILGGILFLLKLRFTLDISVIPSLTNHMTNLCPHTHPHTFEEQLIPNCTHIHNCTHTYVRTSYD